MLRTLTKFAAATAAALFVAAIAQASELACEAAPILLQDVTIVDGSGRWDEQDIFIEDGRISAIGEDIVLETVQAVTVLGRPGAVVRPRTEIPSQPAAIFIRTSTAAAPSPRATAILMPGVPADLVVYGTEAGPGTIEMEILGGRIVGAPAACAS